MHTILKHIGTEHSSSFHGVVCNFNHFRISDDMRMIENRIRNNVSSCRESDVDKLAIMGQGNWCIVEYSEEGLKAIIQNTVGTEEDSKVAVV